jgi:BASS family bile acid:Na+ symporter
LNPEIILKLGLLLGVVLLVVAIGIRAHVEGLMRLLRRPALALRAVAAMYVALPAFVLLVVWFVPLREGVGAALLGFAVAPVLPPWAKKGIAAGGEADYVIGLELLSIGIAVMVIPLMIWIAYQLFVVAAVLEPLAVELVLLATVVVPLALGMGLARFFPDAAPRLAALADRVGGVVLLLGAVVLLIAQGHAILGVLGRGTLVVTVAVVAFGLLVGHLLGGPEPGNRRALASATVLRHPAIALLLATGAFPGNEATVIGTVMLYMIASLLLSVVYERWIRV